MKNIKEKSAALISDLCEKAGLRSGSILVVGCSTSEVLGEKIGTHSSTDTAKEIFDGIYQELCSRGIYLAAQCCEHLNRAIIIEREAAGFADAVNVVPQPKAGGSFATAAYRAFNDPVAIEQIKADAGIDIGGTLIGMHLKQVAVPVRLCDDHLGCAFVLAARTRPKFIGGDRAVYDENLK